MIPSSTIDSVTEYATDASAIIERPDVDPNTGVDNYAVGVKPGWTAPAGWWNWLFNAITKVIGQAKSDDEALIAEINNVLAAANPAITADAADSTQLKTAVLNILRTIATSSVLGAVKSSVTGGEVSVDANGIMTVNGLGDVGDLIMTSPDVVTALNVIYAGLQDIQTGVPARPATYDTDNPVVDTITVDPDTQITTYDTDYHTIDISAGWYYIKIAGGGGAANGTTRSGGNGVLSQNWVYFATPTTLAYCAGTGSSNSIGGTNNFKTVSARLPSYLEGTDATYTGGASVVIDCATQNVFLASGGAGGKASPYFALKNTVMANNIEYVTGCMPSGISEISSGMRPFGVTGWTNSNQGGAGGTASSTPGDTYGGDGWIQIYRGEIVVTPTT